MIVLKNTYSTYTCISLYTCMYIYFREIHGFEHDPVFTL